MKSNFDSPPSILFKKWMPWQITQHFLQHCFTLKIILNKLPWKITAVSNQQFAKKSQLVLMNLPYNTTSLVNCRRFYAFKKNKLRYLQSQFSEVGALGKDTQNWRVCYWQHSSVMYFLSCSKVFTNGEWFWQKKSQKYLSKWSRMFSVGVYYKCYL